MDGEQDRQATVLVVEDVDWIRAGMTRMLRRYGYRVVEASDDLEAIKLAESEHPQLILSEEAVPTLHELAEHARTHPALQNISIVIINPDAEESTRCGNIIVLTDWANIAPLLATPHQ